MKCLAWPLFGLFMVCSVNAFADDRSEVSLEFKEAICQQVASSIPQIDHIGVTVEDCIEFSDVEMVKESADLAALNLIISAGDGYQADCSIHYVKSSLKVKGRPVCEVYVP